MHNVGVVKEVKLRGWWQIHPCYAFTVLCLKEKESALHMLLDKKKNSRHRDNVRALN
jgi:hypothetical protein